MCVSIPPGAHQGPAGLSETVAPVSRGPTFAQAPTDASLHLLGLTDVPHYRCIKEYLLQIWCPTHAATDGGWTVRGNARAVTFSCEPNSGIWIGRLNSDVSLLWPIGRIYEQ